jgi:hypothetical protein
MRITFSTTTKTNEFGSESLKRFVSPAGSRKNRPIARASEKMIVPTHIPLPISSS